jgi:hypothetical protein
VATRRWILVLLSVAMISGLAGCGGSSTNVQNQPAPPVSSVSIAFQPAPPATVSQIDIAPITAVVSNDSTNAGVDWALLCQSTGNCGTLSPLHTASGKAATYTPPTTPSGNIQPVTIEAFATADHTQNVVATINVTGFAGTLKGTYVFETKGEDANGNSGAGGPYQLVGVIVLDGAGNIKSGEQTRNGPLVTVSNPTGPIVSVSDLITGGSYTIGPDGRGTLTINTADENIGQQGIENLSLVVLSSSRALISTLDNVSGTAPLPASGETSIGTLDLQTSMTAPTGGYAFVLNGVDINAGAMAMGGVANIDSPNGISGTGSVADLDDAGIVSPSSTLSGSLTSPDSLGSLKFNLTAGFAPSLQFTGYIVDTAHIKLIESDNGSGTGFGTTAGVAVTQGAARGTFTNNSFAGNYVFDILGQDPLSPTFSNTLASLGQLSADNIGNLNGGYDDETLIASNIVISDSFTGTYTLTGTGRVDSTITFTSSGAGPELIFYLTGNGNPPLVLDADAVTGGIGVGAAHPQSAPPLAFNGKYGLKFVETSSSPVQPNNATGQITVNQASSTLSGVVDAEANYLPQTPAPFTGSFATISSTGRFTGTLTDSLFSSFTSSTNTIPVAFYSVDPNHIFFIETDSATSFELSFGSFATRTPVCPSCP